MGENLEKEEVALPVHLVMVGLREARVKQKLKQFAVAEELGMTERAYRNIELGETKSISVAKLQRLAEILAVESWYDFIKNEKENKNITQILEGDNNSNNNHNMNYATDIALSHELEKQKILLAAKDEKIAALEVRISDLLGQIEDLRIINGLLQSRNV